MLFLPHGTPEQMSWYDELLRTTTTADAAVGLFRARGAVDVVDAARHVSTRTLVVHARDDRVVPVEEGRLLASLVPGARLVALDSANHILLADEPAWEEFLFELREFLGTPIAPAARATLDSLTPRELEVIELVAAGFTNEAIAERLVLSVRTVERHLSTIYAKLRLSGKAARAAAAVSFIEQRTTAGRHGR
jgi:DNA-binding CsgD family transcriptional regulator